MEISYESLIRFEFEYFFKLFFLIFLTKFIINKDRALSNKIL